LTLVKFSHHPLKTPEKQRESPVSPAIPFIFLVIRLGLGAIWRDAVFMVDAGIFVAWYGKT